MKFNTISKTFCIVVEVFIGEKLGYKINSKTQKTKMFKLLMNMLGSGFGKDTLFIFPVLEG